MSVRYGSGDVRIPDIRRTAGYGQERSLGKPLVRDIQQFEFIEHAKTVSSRQWSITDSRLAVHLFGLDYEHRLRFR